MRKRELANACVFVDWNNVRNRFPVNVGKSNAANLRRVIYKIQDECADILRRSDSTGAFKVTTRFYDGWHRENRPTSIRLELEKLFRETSCERRIGSIYFSGMKYGNELACDSFRNPLTATSRDSGQKMVDTAIVCDFLYLLRQRYVKVGLIASDDDDFIPAALTAEAWGLEGYLIRSPGRGLDSVTEKIENSPIKFWRE
ncbi:TPA: NYN domain-containing protein [Burkholderia vietnamiensis]|nr:NYN domain-containing protein [Burkholderia vietnamiensis]